LNNGSATDAEEERAVPDGKSSAESRETPSAVGTVDATPGGFPDRDEVDVPPPPHPAVKRKKQRTNGHEKHLQLRIIEASNGYPLVPIIFHRERTVARPWKLL
jgi:hypothetical protein